VDWQPSFTLPTLRGTDIPAKKLSDFFPGIEAAVSGLAIA
jgi:hypothetical protein